jgi:FixJ family two-component response regulator
VIEEVGVSFLGLVHLVDDDLLFATAMQRRLEQAGYEVASYASAEDLLDRLPIERFPSCILLDVKMRGMDGLALQTRLRELGSTLPIIFVTGHTDISIVVRTIKAGAIDYLTKPVTPEEVVRAVERAFAHHVASRTLQQNLEPVRTRIQKLTPREYQVFELIISGKTNKHIARALGCTERTIKAHRHRVMEKLQVQTLAELVSLAERAGVLGSASRSRQTA